MAKIFLSTPTLMPAWFDVAQQLSRNSHQIVGQLAHLSDDQAQSSLTWDLIDATEPRYEYLSSSTLSGYQPAGDYSEVWKKHEDIFRGLMNRKVWYALRREPKSVFEFFCEYWSSILESKNPNVIIFGTTPHTCYDYPLLALAKYLNIRTLILTKVPYTHFSFIREGVLENEKSNGEIIKGEKDQTDPYILNTWLERCRGDHNSVKPTHWDKPKEHISISLNTVTKWGRYFRHRPLVISRAIAEKLISPLKWKMLEKKYNYISTTPDLSETYVYFPLHFQPERTTSPEGGEYYNQVKFAKKISQALPDNVKLYIKEHPSQFKNYRGWMGRSLKYYEDLREISSVELISFGPDQYELIDNALAVVSVTGTAVIESILRGTPATAGGHPWYSQGLLYRAQTEEGRRKFFSEGINDIDCIANYLKEFLCTLQYLSKRCYIQGHAASTHPLSRCDNAKNLTELIGSKI